MSPVPSITLNRPRWRAWGGAAALGAALVILGIGQALAQAANRIEGNAVVVTLTEQAGLAADTPTVSRFAEARPGEATHVLRDVDFRRGKNGEARIIVDLSDNTTGIDIRQQGKLLIVDFIKTTLP